MPPRLPNPLPLLARLSTEPLLIRPGCEPLIAALGRRALDLHARPAAAGPDAAPELAPWEEAEAVRLYPGGVAVVPVRGVLCAGLDAITAWYFGLARPEAIQTAARNLAADTTVSLVVFDVDSPGGYTTAIPETAQLIADLTTRKATLAYTAGLCCSAAYWLASQCEKIVAMPSATVGSIGTYCTIYDTSKMFEQAGVTAHLIAAGDFKGQGTPGVPVTAEFLALLQSGVDRINAKFLAAVRAGREVGGKKLADADLQGQWFDGEQAVEKNLADATALNLAEVLTRLLTPDLAAV